MNIISTNLFNYFYNLPTRKPTSNDWKALFGRGIMMTWIWLLKLRALTIILLTEDEFIRGAAQTKVSRKGRTRSSQAEKTARTQSGGSDCLQTASTSLGVAEIIQKETVVHKHEYLKIRYKHQSWGTVSHETEQIQWGSSQYRKYSPTFKRQNGQSPQYGTNQQVQIKFGTIWRQDDLSEAQPRVWKYWD